MSHPDYDLLIAGAGPAGSTLALNLAGSGLRVAIVDRDVFPRPKICGDALSGKVLSVMKRLPGGVYDDFIRSVAKVASGGIRFMAPGGTFADISFPGAAKQKDAPGFVCSRTDFDAFLLDKARQIPTVRMFEGEKVTTLERQPDRIVVSTEKQVFSTRVVAGADGVHSLVQRTFAPCPPRKDHIFLGIRGYYENVEGMHPDHFIEMIFLEELLPGYFWIFPGPGGLVNAGFGMLQSNVVRRKVNMSRLFRELVTGHPLLAPRFAGARAIGKTEAHALPLGSHSLPRSGERFLLLGDAAFLVDPFSGEGIGNAMASGEIAASILETCFQQNDFSASAMSAYDARIRRRFAGDFRTMHLMQKLARHRRLMNYVIGKAARNADIRDMLSGMYTNEDLKKKLTRPGFYMGLLVRRDK